MCHDPNKYVEKLDASRLASIQEHAQHETLALLIIDEISNVSPDMLAQMEKREREKMNNDLPFGGLAIMSMGDFCQLSPVPPAEPLYSALIKSIIKPITLNSKSTSTGPKIEGALLFATFIKIELTQQMRAANDPQHMAFLNELRSSSGLRSSCTKKPLNMYVFMLDKIRKYVLKSTKYVLKMK